MAQQYKLHVLPCIQLSNLSYEKKEFYEFPITKYLAIYRKYRQNMNFMRLRKTNYAH